MDDDSASYIFNDCLIGGVNRPLDNSELTLSYLYFDLLTSQPDLDEFPLPATNSYLDRSPDGSDGSATCPEILAVDSSASNDKDSGDRKFQAKKDHCYMGLLGRHAEGKNTTRVEYGAPPALLFDQHASTEPLLADDDASISAAKFLTVGTSKSEDFSRHPANSVYFSSTPDQYGSDFSSPSPNSSCTGGVVLIEDEYTDTDLNMHENSDTFSMGSAADRNLFEISRNGQKLYKSIDSDSSRYRSKMQDLALKHKLITNQNSKTCGQLMLSAEERRTLIQEGYSIPSSLPLSRKEEEALKIVRRKIKNKLSAQESRRRRKEYTDELERNIRKCQSENHSLRVKVDGLEQQNQTLIGELKKLQVMVGHESPAASNFADKHTSAPGVTGVTLTVTFLLFAFLLPSFPVWTRLSLHKFGSNDNLSNQVHISANDDPLAHHVYEAAKNAPITLHPDEPDCSYSSQWFLFDQSKRRQPPSCPASRLLVDSVVESASQKTPNGEDSINLIEAVDNIVHQKVGGGAEKSTNNVDGAEPSSTNEETPTSYDSTTSVKISTNQIAGQKKSSNGVKGAGPPNPIGYELLGGVSEQADVINESVGVASFSHICDSICVERMKSRLLVA